MAHFDLSRPDEAHGRDLEPRDLSPREATEELVGRVIAPGPRYRTLVIAAAALFALGLVGFVVRAAVGPHDRAAWGYYVAFFPWLLSTALAAPIVAWMTRGAKGQWGRTLRRAAELPAAAGLLALLWFIPILFLIPPLYNGQTYRFSTWFFWPNAPYLYDLFAVLGLVFLGYGMLYVSSLPDIAAVRDALPPDRRGWFQGLARGFRGTKHQWWNVQHGVAVLGGIYLAFFVYVEYVVSVDLSQSLIPGFFSSVFPPYNVVTGLEGGLATAQLMMGLLRWVGGFRNYLALDQFWSLAKIQLALGLFWFYFFWSEFIVTWYGRTPREQAVDTLIILGPYLLCFILAALGLFLIPFLSLIWNKVRVSIKGPFVVACCTLVGLFFDRVRLYVSAWSVPNPYAEMLDAVPPTHYPDLADILMILGGLGGAALLILIALRFVPAVSLWEYKEALVLRQSRPYLRGTVRVIGKPR